LRRTVARALAVSTSYRLEFIVTPFASSTTHIAFQVKKKALVDAFYQAVIAAGGNDNGKPGLRPQYNPNYYDGFVLDPNGYNIEVVCRETEEFYDKFRGVWQIRLTFY
jgi:hypothetical protein